MRKLLLVGVGDAARAVARAAREGESAGGAGEAATPATLTGTTRDVSKFPALRALGVWPLEFGEEAVRSHAAGADVLVSLPPDGHTDELLAPLLRDAGSVVYLSSTAVYGKREGIIDESTPVDAEDDRALRRLVAEALYRGVGARVLRVPALYGPENGLHLRLLGGHYRMPGDGSGFVSRLHFVDLAAFVLAAFTRGTPCGTYLLGDEEPAPHRDVVAFVCERLGLALPLPAPLSEVSPTLRGSRRVNGSRARAALGIALRYPSYREGYGFLTAGEPGTRAPDGACSSP